MIARPLSVALAAATFAVALSAASPVLAQAPHHLNGPGDPHFCAVPPDHNAQTLTQPDGRTFEARHIGQGPVSYLETAEGYTVRRDPVDGFFKFAVAGPGGHLLLTEVVADELADLSEADARLAGSLAPHARVSPGVLAKAQRAQRARKAAAAPTDIRDADAKDAGRVDRIYGAFPSEGVRRALMLLVDYPDQRHDYQPADIERLCNEPGYSRNGQTGSFRDFYLDATYGALEVNTDVREWYTADSARAFYGVQSLEEREFDRVPALVREAVDDAEERGVDFSEYDNDGDGRVDVVFVIHAGRGAEESADEGDIWSHRWVLRAADQAVTYDGVSIDDYIIQPEIYRDRGQLTNIGVLTHEFGHALGLPDLYDTDGGSAGVGRWCLMSSGTWNDGGRTPAQPSAWCKAAMGWMTPTEIEVGAEETVTGLRATGRAPGAYQLLTDDPEEYFLVETRGDDKWDSGIPAAGLVIYHVDTRQRNNREPDNYFIDVEQADGDRDLNLDENRGDGGDVFPGASRRRVFDCDTDGGPQSERYDGEPSNVKLTGITYASGRGGFTYGACFTACTYARVEPEADGIDYDCDDGTYARDFRVYAGPGLGQGAVVLKLTDDEGRVYTGRADEPADPYTVVTVSDLPFGVSGLRVVAEQEDGTCRLVAEEPIPGVLACPLANDAICGAIDLTAAIDADPIAATTAGHGVQDGEPSPLLGSGLGERGWSGDPAQASAWFSFEAPATGHLVLESDDDLRVAVYEADGCGALRAGDYLGVAATDGDRLGDMRCLLPGQRYFLQVDGGEDEGDFTLRLSAGREECDLSTERLDCAEARDESSNGSGTWLHLRDERGDVFASVNDLGNDLGDITVLHTLNRTRVRRLPDNQRVFKRDYRLGFEREGEAVIRVYVPYADFQDLNQLLGTTDLTSLVLRRSGETDCGELGDVTLEESAPELVARRYSGFNSLIQYRIGGSGTYVLKTATPRRTRFVRFAASAKTEDNELAWTTDNEVALESFTVQSREDESSAWIDLGTVEPEGSDGDGADYLFAHQTQARFTEYRIRRNDEDGLIGYSEVASVERSVVGVGEFADGSPLTLAPNPARGSVQVGAAGATAIELIDTRGALVSRVAVSPGAEQTTLALDGVAAGAYTVRVIGERGVGTVRLVVQ